MANEQMELKKRIEELETKAGINQNKQSTT